MKTRGSGRIVSAMAVVLSSQFLCTAASRADDDEGHHIRHVLLLSIDGFHQFDLTSCVPSGGCPNLAALSRRGVTYTNARTTTPSDSFPGLLAQLTGEPRRRPVSTMMIATTGLFFHQTENSPRARPVAAAIPELKLCWTSRSTMTQPNCLAAALIRPFCPSSVTPTAAAQRCFRTILSRSTRSSALPTLPVYRPHGPTSILPTTS